MGARAGHRGLRHRARPAVGHGRTRRRRGESSIWLDLGISAEANRRRGGQEPATTGGRTRRARPARARRSSWTAARRTAPTAGPTSTRSASWRSGTCVFMQDEVDDHSRRRRELADEEHGHRIRAGARGDGHPGRGQRLRDRPVPPDSRPRRRALSGERHGQDAKDDVSLKIVAEHGRATAFLIADGVQPANEGRGYILRRMLRRAVAHARRLGIEGAVMEPADRAVIDVFGEAYPELARERAFIRQVAASEEERFSATLRHGMVLFERAPHGAGDRRPARGRRRLPARTTRTGSPSSWSAELAEEAGPGRRQERFRELLQEQRERAQRAAKKVEVGPARPASVPATEFVGYERSPRPSRRSRWCSTTSTRARRRGGGAAVAVFLERTPFYAEGGGQVGDRGVIRTATGTVRVEDAQRAGSTRSCTSGTVRRGEVRAGQDAIGRDRRARARGDGPSAHVDPRRALDAQAPPRRARPAGGLARRARAGCGSTSRIRPRLPRRDAGGGRAGGEPPPRRRRRRSGSSRPRWRRRKSLGAVALFEREVRRHRARGRDRRLLAGAVRRHARASHGQRRGRCAFLGEGSIGAGMRRVEARGRSRRAA